MPGLSKHQRGGGSWVSPDARPQVRYYTPDKLGPRCRVCGTLLPLALADAGDTTHPMCDPLTARPM